MKPNYLNWIPPKVTYGFAAGALAGTALTTALTKARHRLPKPWNYLAIATSAAATTWAAGFSAYCFNATRYFDFDAPDSVSRRIIEGVASYVNLPEDGIGLDVGCGSGALTIACAKRNPQASMMGVDMWSGTYTQFSQKLCEDNAAAEGVTNTIFERGNALHLDFTDETFDLVTSNYVYHNIAGRDKQEILRETLRVLKKGGTFVIHDLMGPLRYGDMQAFVRELLDEGYQEVRLVDVTNGLFMTKSQSRMLALFDSTLLIGTK